MTRNQNGQGRVWALLIGCALTLLAQPGSARAAGRADDRSAIDAVLDQSRAVRSGDDFLPPEKAFQLSAIPDGAERVRLIWAIAPGYYLYRDRIKMAGTAAHASVGALQLPDGQVKSDEYFGKQVVYHNELVATLPVRRTSDGALDLSLQVTYQGCAEAGLCYPPVTRTLAVQLPPGGPSAAADAGGSAAARAAARRPGPGSGPLRTHAPMSPSRTGWQASFGPATSSSFWAISLPWAWAWPSPRAAGRWCRSSPASSSGRAIGSPRHAGSCCRWPTSSAWR